MINKSSSARGDEGGANAGFFDAKTLILMGIALGLLLLWRFSVKKNQN